MPLNISEIGGISSGTGIAFVFPNASTGISTTRPNRPAWLCGWTGNLSISTSWVIPTTWSTPAFNIGGYFNTSTGKFTAPVSGNYLLVGGILKSSSNVCTRHQFYRNETSFGLQFRTTEAYAGYNESMTHEQIYYAAAGDTLSFRHYADSATTLYNDSGSGAAGSYNFFGGILLG